MQPKLTISIDGQHIRKLTAAAEACTRALGEFIKVLSEMPGAITVVDESRYLTTELDLKRGGYHARPSSGAISPPVGGSSIMPPVSPLPPEAIATERRP